MRYADPVAELNRLRIDVFRDRRQTTLRLAGPIDETASLHGVGPILAPVVVDLGHVTLINSRGVREWVKFLRALTPRGSVSLRHCPACMVSQFNLVRGAASDVVIESFDAPYACEACGHQDMLELEPAVHLPSGSDPPTFPCERCGGAMRFDDFPESYFMFLDRKPG